MGGCRKAVLTIFYFTFVMPALCGALLFASMSPWIANRDFYIGLLDNNAIYDAVLSEEWIVSLSKTNTDAESQQAMLTALKDVVEPETLRNNAVTIVNDVFDFIEGKSETLELYFDVSQIKDALEGEGGSRFARTLVANLPACEAGQTGLESDALVQTCIPEGVSAAEAEETVRQQIQTRINETPDRIPLTDEVIVRDESFRAVGDIQGVLAGSVVSVLLPALAVWFIVGLISGEDMRARFIWWGWTLVIPAAIILSIGLSINTNIIPDISQSIVQNASFNADNEALEQALITTLTDGFRTVANGFISTGGVATVGAIVLMALGWFTPRRREDIIIGQTVIVGDDKPKRA